MIIVIADDVTGAAEMAGVALRNGLDVQFITEISCCLLYTSDAADDSGTV